MPDLDAGWQILCVEFHTAMLTKKASGDKLSGAPALPDVDGLHRVDAHLAVGAVVGFLDPLMAVEAHTGERLLLDVPRNQLFSEVRTESLREEFGPDRDLERSLTSPP